MNFRHTARKAEKVLYVDPRKISQRWWEETIGPANQQSGPTKCEGRKVEVGAIIGLESK
jgi:hypothetical protein